MSERLIKAARDMLQEVHRMLNDGEWYEPWNRANELSEALEEAGHPEHRGDARRHFICLCPDCIRPKPRSFEQRVATVQELNTFLEDWVKRHGPPDAR